MQRDVKRLAGFAEARAGLGPVIYLGRATADNANGERSCVCRRGGQVLGDRTCQAVTDDGVSTGRPQAPSARFTENDGGAPPRGEDEGHLWPAPFDVVGQASFAPWHMPSSA